MPYIWHQARLPQQSGNAIGGGAIVATLCRAIGVFVVVQYRRSVCDYPPNAAKYSEAVCHKILCEVEETSRRHRSKLMRLENVTNTSVQVTEFLLGRPRDSCRQKARTTKTNSKCRFPVFSSSGMIE